MSPTVVALCPVYNHRHLLDESFACLSAQDLPMTVVWCDDASTDGSVARLRELIAGYGGHHRMLLRSNTQNLGHGLNLFAAMTEHPADYYLEFDDDASLPHRARTQIESLAADPDLMLVGCDFEYADACCRPLGHYERYRPGPQRITDFVDGRHYLHVAGHTFAWKQAVYTRFPPPRSRVSSADFVLAWRAAMLGHFSYSSEVLVRYRTTAHSVSRSPLSHGRCVADAHAFYARRAQVFEGIAVQLATDLAIAEREGLVTAELAARLRSPRADIEYQARSLEVVRAAAAGQRGPWMRAALRGLRNPRLRPQAWRHLALALVPRLFYLAKQLLGRRAP